MAPRSPGPPRWVTRGGDPWVPHFCRKCLCRMVFRRPCGKRRWRGGPVLAGVVPDRRRPPRCACRASNAEGALCSGTGRPMPGIMKAISPWGDVAVNSDFSGRRRTGAHPGGLGSGASGVGESAGTRREGVALAVPARQPLPGLGRRTPGPGSFWPAGGNDEPSTNGCGQRRSAR